MNTPISIQTDDRAIAFETRYVSGQIHEGYDQKTLVSGLYSTDVVPAFTDRMKKLQAAGFNVEQRLDIPLSLDNWMVVKAEKTAKGGQPMMVELRLKIEPKNAAGEPTTALAEPKKEEMEKSATKTEVVAPAQQTLDLRTPVTPVAPKLKPKSIHSAIYTIVYPGGRFGRKHRTLKLKTIDQGKSNERTFIKYMNGSDNEGNYSENAAIHFLNSGRTIMLGRFKDQRYAALAQELTEAIKILQGDPIACMTAYGKSSGKCAVCGRTLTEPESISYGIGPVCRQRLGIYEMVNSLIG